jgi:hypothetical protein
MVKILFTLLFSYTLSLGFAQTQTAPFSVVIFGDMPYTLPEDYAKFERLIAAVNQEKQVFNIHLGDFKSSTTPCTEDYFHKIYNYFQQFEKPLIYTPGDNEWTDCSKKEAGAYVPEERLAVVRKTFFSNNNKSFGKEKLDLTPQSLNPVFSKYVENNRWEYGQVTFATVHLVGSNNNFLVESKSHIDEFYERDSANIAWIEEVFKTAKAHNSLGIALFTQADMFNDVKESTGFKHFLEKLTELTVDFKKPVLLVNGDSHRYLIDKPLFVLKGKKNKQTIMNFTRLQSFGEGDVHASKLTIDPNYKELFQIEQLLIKGN